MRGKNLIWASVIAMLLASIMAIPRPVRAQGGSIFITPATITVYDPVIDPADLSLNSYTVDIMIDNAADLYAYGFRVRANFALLYVPADNVVVGSDTILSGQPDGIDVAKAIDLASGYVQVSVSTIGEHGGVYGNGKLASITFQLRDVGTCSIEVTDVELIDSFLTPMEPDSVTGGTFASIATQPFAGNLVDLFLNSLTYSVQLNGTGGLLSVPLMSKVKNMPSPYPLYIYVMWTLVRASPAKAFHLKTSVIKVPAPHVAELDISFTFVKALAGTWNIQVTAWYSYGGSIYHESRKTKTAILTILP